MPPTTNPDVPTRGPSDGGGRPLTAAQAAALARMEWRGRARHVGFVMGLTCATSTLLGGLLVLYLNLGVLADDTTATRAFLSAMAMLGLWLGPLVGVAYVMDVASLWPAPSRHHPPPAARAPTPQERAVAQAEAAVTRAAMQEVIVA